MKKPMASTPQSGQFNGTMAVLKREGLPLTRENYLRFELLETEYAGHDPKTPLPAELEAELPPEIQL
jgi:hypothetical protein